MMGFHLASRARADWPALAWAARVRRDGAVDVVAGTAVEHDGDGWLAGASASAFSLRAPPEARTSIGTGLWLRPDHLAIHCGNAGSDIVFVHRGKAGLVIANALPALLAMAEDAPRVGYPFYNQDLMGYLLGGKRYRRDIPLRDGAMTPYYRSLRIGADLSVEVVPAPAPPAFGSFAAYRDFLCAELRALFANADDPARSVRYAPVGTLSTGYDSVAAMVMARAAGCDEAITYREASFTAPGTSDSGEAIAQALGVTITGFETQAYQRRTDFPELEFISAGYGGPQVCMAGSEAALTKRLVVTGFGGDFFWDRDLGLKQRLRPPLYAGGYSMVNFLLRLPALNVAVPAIGAAGNPGAIGTLSRGAEMAAWTLGGDYDRPLPRRIAEEAGVPRGTFAQRKLMVTPGYETLGRGRLPLEHYLSPASLGAFRSWLREHGGFPARRARWRNKAVAPLARLFWTGRLARWAVARGWDWPPFPAALAHLRAAVRENGWVFAWAMEREVARYIYFLDRIEEPDRRRPITPAESGSVRDGV